MDTTLDRWTRPTPPEWQANLEEVFPRSDKVPWLKIAWHSGISYAKTMRWVIYAMQPRLDIVPEDILACCRGEDPRTWGVWVTPKVSDEYGRTSLGKPRWVSDSFISHLQWQLFQETQCFPQLFWIIQGDKGGHRWQVSDSERAFLEAIGRPDADTPQIGALPYAEYDNRVREKLLELDKLRQWRQSWDKRLGANVSEAGIMVQSERKALREAYARKTLDWLDSQVVEAVDDIPRKVLAQIVDQLPTSDVSPDERSEQLHEALIERA